jgi:hypothetical protein
MVSEPFNSEFIGSIFTDVAMLIVGDPCKILSEHQYENYLDQHIGGLRCEIWRTPTLGDSVTVNTGGCDGWCPVFLERARDGKPLRLVIGLVPRMSEEDDRPIRDEGSDVEEAK